MNDLRFAFRQLLKNPGFTAVAVLTLALGIGACTAMFSAVDAVLLRPQPYPQSERLVNVFERSAKGGRNSVAGASFIDWRDHQTQFEALAIYASDRLDLTGHAEPEKINALSVSSGFNRVLGLSPLLGRGFEPEDEQVGGQNDVVMLTERFWRNRFDGSPSVIGETLQLDGRARTIIGVMPDQTWPQPNVSVFVPYALVPNSYLTSHDVHRARVLGRLAPGATLAQAESELNAIKQNLEATYPASKKTWGVTLQPMREVMAESPKPVLLLLFGAVALVLLIACANVANLLLARASTRQCEIAVRAARDVAAAIHRLDPSLPLANLQTLEHAMKDSLGPQKLILNLIGAFAGTALLLASIGLYGVMAYSVASRQRELSIRLALGAARRDVMRLIIGRGVRLMTVGLILGLLGAMVLTQLMGSLLFGIGPTDPLTFTAVPLLLVSVALPACWLPARRAAKVDPIEALRQR